MKIGGSWNSLGHSSPWGSRVQSTWPTAFADAVRHGSSVEVTC